MSAAQMIRLPPDTSKIEILSSTSEYNHQPFVQLAHPNWNVSINLVHQHEIQETLHKLQDRVSMKNAASIAQQSGDP